MMKIIIVFIGLLTGFNAVSIKPYLLIANQGIEDFLYQAELQYSSNRYLYKKLKDSTNLVPSWGAIHDFYVASQQSSVGKFTDIKDAFTEFDMSNPQITENDSLIKVFMIEIAENDSLISMETDSTTLANLHSENKAAYSSINDLRTANKILQDSLQILRNTYIDSLKLQNSAVSSNTLVEQNEKTINDIFFSTIAKYNFAFTESQKEIITDIAHQCPYTGGEAVYRARVLHIALTGLMDFNDSTACAIQGINWRHANNTTSIIAQSVEVVPNPTNGKATFVLHSPLTQNATIYIYNSLGQKVGEYKALQGAKNIPFETQGFAKGLYYYSIDNLTGKFIVEK